MPRSRRSAAPNARIAAPPGAGAAWLALVVPFVLACIVHRHVLGLFFSSDDLVQLQRTVGLVPQPPLLWRPLSLRLWDAALWRLFGADPQGWHALSLLVHATNAALVGAWSRRLGLAPPVALAAASAFAVTPLATSAVSQVATTSELLALSLSLGALLALDARRVAGPLLHALALLAKENVLFVPLVAAIRGSGDRDARPAPWRLMAVAVAASVAMLAYVALVLLRPGSGFLRAEAYGVAAGPNVFANLVAYAAWSAWFVGAEPAGPPHAPGVQLAGLVALATMGVAAWRPGARAVRAGLALWLLSLVPVLPLVRQSYPHYVYVGFAGWIVAVASLAHAGLARLPAIARAPLERRRAWGWAAACVLSLLLALSGELAWSIRLGTRISAMGLPVDSMLRRMEFAANARRALAETLPAGTERVVIVNPPGAQGFYNVRTGERVATPDTTGPSYDLASAVLAGGAALRPFFPELAEIRIVDRFSAADSGASLATILADGRIMVLGQGAEAHVALGRLWVGAGLAEDAREHLAIARAVYPTSADLALSYAISGVADSAEGERGLRDVIARFAGTPAAAQAADLLGRMGRPVPAARP